VGEGGGELTDSDSETQIGKGTHEH
jgi:hypothetical protein